MTRCQCNFIFVFFKLNEKNAKKPMYNQGPMLDGCWGGGLQPTSWNPRPTEDTPPGWQASILEPIGRGGHVG